MKYSIIIPSYNSAPYIHNCLYGLINQIYDKNKYEIIIVDDYSTDNQNEIIEQLIRENKTNHIRLIKHTENLKQGAARNTGIKEATGEWILFLDSDDCIVASNTLEEFDKIINCTPDLEIVRSISSHIYYNDNNKNIPLPKSFNKIDETTGIEYLSADKYFTDDLYVVWASCYKKSFLQKYDLYFKEKMFYEDTDWTIRTLWNCHKMCIIDFPFVGHRIRTDSTSQKPNLKIFIDKITGDALADKYIEEYHMTGNCLKLCRKRNLRRITDYIKKTKDYSISNSLYCLNYLRHNTQLLIPTKYDLSLKHQIMFYILKYHPKIIVISIKIAYILKRHIFNKIAQIFHK